MAPGVWVDEGPGSARLSGAENPGGRAVGHMLPEVSQQMAHISRASKSPGGANRLGIAPKRRSDFNKKIR